MADYATTGLSVRPHPLAQLRAALDARGFVTTAQLGSLPNGTELSVRTNEVIDSKTANVDQTYSAVVANDVLDNSGRVTIPKGSDARLVIRSASGGSITSASDLVLDVDSLTVSGSRYTVSTGDLTQQGGQESALTKRQRSWWAGARL